MASSSPNRIARLAEELDRQGVDVFLASHPVSMEYLHGFAEDGFERFLMMAVRANGEVVLISPALSETRAKRCGFTDVRTWNDSEDPLALFRHLAEQWELRSKIIYVDGFMPAFMLLSMQEALPAALFKSGQDLLARLMRQKDLEEIELMRRAGRIADSALPAALEKLRPGMSELQFEGILRSEMQELGGKPTFCIIAAGSNSAEPHHESDGTIIKNGDVLLCDFGCSVQGYNSDTTRVVGIGKVSEEVRRVYSAVYEAQKAAREAIRPGVAAQEIDRAARAQIEQCGYGQYFIHRTGHGIGLREHEEPYIVEGADLPLAEGDCFSIEPGIYLPGKFGVRIENIVTPTSAGHESFNAEPSEELVII